MEDRTRDDELYAAYQNRWRELEEELEVQQRRQKKFDEKQERRNRRMAANQVKVEEMIAQWGSSEESGRIYSMLDEYVTEEQRELDQEAEALRENYKNLKIQQQLCEETYWEERNRLEETI